MHVTSGQQEVLIQFSPTRSYSAIFVNAVKLIKLLLLSTVPVPNEHSHRHNHERAKNSQVVKDENQKTRSKYER